AVLHRNGGTGHAARHRADRIMAGAPAAGRDHVHLPRGQRPAGDSTGQHRNFVPVELRADPLPCRESTGHVRLHHEGVHHWREERRDPAGRRGLRRILRDPRARLCAYAGPDPQTPPRDAWRGAVPVLDAENPPARLSRDAPVQKSNFMAYNIHAVWQQEVWAAVERSRKYIDLYMGGLCTAQDVEDADALIIASGSAAAQSREAVRLCADKGIKVGLIKIRSLRPFPTAELRQLCAKAKLIVIPEFNYVGWLAREVATAIYGHSKAKIIAGPHVYGGQSMPVELIVDEVESGLTGKKSTNVPLSAIMGTDVDPAAMAHFMRSI